MAAPRQSRPPKITTTPAEGRTNKTAITLETWEAQTTLDAEQTANVAALKAACELKPLPLKFQVSATPGTSRAATPTPHGRGNQLATPESRPNTPVANVKGQQTNRILHWEHPISTPEQFHDWLAKVDRSVVRSQESHFHAHLDTIKGLLDTCNRLLEDVKLIETQLDSMLEGWKSVEESGKSLKEGCEHLLEEKAVLIETSEAIASRLEYFQELDSATRILNRPGQSIVLNPDFLLMVERVDVCLDFLQNHREYRDAEIYIMRYQQCLTRAMTLIQLYFTNTLKNITSEIQKQTNNKELSETARVHLLYTKFQGIATPLAPLILELERRAKLGESQALLDECRAGYCSARRALMTSKVITDIRGLDPARSELVDLTRAGCGYLKQVCMDEFKLFKLFFNSGEAQLYAYLETLCDYLYDDLRPRILHEQRLQVLRDVCTVLQALMVLDVDSETYKLSDESSDEDEDQLSIPLHNGVEAGGSQPFALRKLRVGHLLQLILQDAQTRLIFRSQAVLQSEVKNFVGKGNDLDYPNILQAGQTSNSNGHRSTPSGEESVIQTPSFTKPQTWYPTLKRAENVISQLHGCVKPSILSDLAREAVIFCAYSLQIASQTLTSKNMVSADLHGRLFLIRHLLILKEMTANLDLELSDGQPDSLNVADALGSLLKGAGILTSNLLASMGMVSGTEAIVDARMEIDKDLRNACDAFIDYCSKTVTKPLHDFVEKCFEVLPNESSGAHKIDGLAAKDFATTERLSEIHEAFKAACSKEIAEWMRWLRLYLETDKTAQVLIPPLQSQIVEEYTRFWELVKSNYPADVVDRIMSLTDLWAFLKDNCRVEL